MANELARIEFNQDQIDLIKSQIAPKATDDELKLFIYQAKRTGLDPLARQIYAIHRKVKQGNEYVEKMTIQTSIDGFRVIAERSGDYGGQDEPVFVKEEGKLYCKVTVYRFRGDVRYPAAVGVAYWDEYCPMYNGTPSGLWSKMPHTMLSKVAEALALRKAYPQDLSGLYTGEEMSQADRVEPEVKPVSEVDEGDRALLVNLVRSSDLTHDEQEMAFSAISLCPDYATYQKIEARLQDRQQAFDTIPNPSATDLKKHLRKTVKA